MQQNTLQAILQRQTRRWEEICYHLERLEEDPLVLITEIFRGGDLFLAERLKGEGGDVLQQVQSHWLSHLLPALIDYFGESDIQLVYDMSQELSPIYIQYNGQLVAHFSPYWRVFQTYDIPGKEEMLERKRVLIEEGMGLDKQLEQLTSVAENPALIANEDTWGYAKALLRPKKHQKEMQEAVQIIEARLFEIQRELQSVTDKLTYLEREYTETSYCLDKIKRKVERWGDFSFVEPVEEENV